MEESDEERLARANHVIAEASEHVTSLFMEKVKLVALLSSSTLALGVLVLTQIREIITTADLVLFGIAGLCIASSLLLAIASAGLMAVLPLRPHRNVRKDATRPYDLSFLSIIFYIVGFAFFVATVASKLG